VRAGDHLHLYTYLDKLQERAIYWDTDSVVYGQPRDVPAVVETGNNLGTMTSELKTSEIMEEFVSGGPINYAYKTVHAATGERKTVCKIRGITLNYSTLQLVNFKVIKDMVLDGTKMRHVIVHTETRKTGVGIVSIITEPEDTVYRISFFKLRRLGDNSSVPYGYK